LVSLAVVSVLVSLVVNYSFKVVELVSLLFVVNYVVDLMMCVILVLCMIYHVYSTYFVGSPSREAAKTSSSKK
jgi:putative copper export protein